LENYYVYEPIKGIRLLKIALIYGSNASGKSTVIEALNFFRDLVLNPLEKKTETIKYTPFLLDKDTIEGDSSFKLNFITANTRYHYEVVFNKKAIKKEVLYKYNSNKPSIVYKRISDIEKQITKIEKTGKDFLNKDSVTALENATLWNNTVLGGFLKTNVESTILKDIVHWFDRKLKPMIAPKTDLYGYVSSKIEKGEIHKSNVTTLLKKADLMIDSILFEKEEIPLDDEMIEAITKITTNIPEKEIEEIKTKKKFVSTKVAFIHKTDTVSCKLDYTDESLGTQRFYQLCGILDLLIRTECIFPIDEIENSLHPDLLEHFLRIYLANAKKSQLIVTTHYRELLMNREILRNDAIWFTEKKKNGSTDLFCLDDFDSSVVRDTSSIYNAYKIGKLGAKPNLGDYYIDLENDEEDK